MVSPPVLPHPQHQDEFSSSALASSPNETVSKGARPALPLSRPALGPSPGGWFICTRSSAAARGRTIPRPRWHRILLTSDYSSPPLHIQIHFFFTVLTVFCFFFWNISTSYVHITVSHAMGRPCGGHGLWMSSSCPLVWQQAGPLVLGSNK